MASMFEPAFMRLALVASIATGVSLGVLGVYLVIRRVVFLGLVIANAATLGAALAQAVGWPPELTSVAAAVGAAATLGGVEASTRVSAESLMGWAYAAASSATVLVLSWAATGNSDTSHLLFGNVLAVQFSSVVGLTILAVTIGLMQLLFARRFLLVTFDPEAARVAGVNTRMWSLALNLAIGVAAAAAVQTMGALSTFAFLTLPAMAALLAATSVRATFATAAALSIVLPAAALALSFYRNLPAGAASVALLALSVPLAAISTIATALWQGRGEATRPTPPRRIGAAARADDPVVNWPRASIRRSRDTDGVGGAVRTTTQSVRRSVSRLRNSGVMPDEAASAPRAS